MHASKKERVHQILWDWGLDQFHGPGKCPEYRLEMARTLYRLAHSATHVRDLFTLMMVEDAVVVQSTLSWAAYDTLLSFPLATCRQLSSTIEPQLARLLRHDGKRNLLACEMILKLAQQGRLADSVLRALDEPMAAVLHDHHPCHHDAVLWVTQYFLLRRSPKILKPRCMLPCGGLAWSSAIEYIAANHEHPPVGIGMAPDPSEIPLEHLVDRWSVHVQTFFIRASSAMSSMHGQQLLGVLEVLYYCHKARDQGQLDQIVPTILGILETLDHTTPGDYRMRIWDAGWGLLESLGASAQVVQGLPRIMALLGRLPELSPHWSKDYIQKVLTHVVHLGGCHGLDMVNDVNILGTSLLEVLPDDLVHRHMDTLVHKLKTGYECGARPHHDLACVRFICRMTTAEQAAHRDFVASHVRTMTAFVSMDNPDTSLQTTARHLLSLIPEHMFDACVPELNHIIGTGDSAGMLALYHLPTARLRVLRQTILYRVLTLHDIYNDVAPSPALLLMCHLPDDVLAPIVTRLIRPDRVEWEGRLLHLLSDPYHNAAKRLFILQHLPKSLFLPHHVHDIAAQWLGHTELGKSHMILNIVLKTAAVSVCEEHKEWCMDALLQQPASALYRQAHRMLMMLPASSLLAVMMQKRHHLPRMYPRYLCALWNRLDDQQLALFVDDIVHLFHTSPFLFMEDRWVRQLARLPFDRVWALKDPILALLQQRDRTGGAWKEEGTKHLLGILSHAGVTLAREMLSESTFKHV